MNEKLIPVIIQDQDTKQVLSLFYCNKQSIRKMRETGLVWRFSRSKNVQMMKGATSGNVQRIASLSYDCDRDALLAVVRQVGTGACHTGSWSCFTKGRERSWGVLDELASTIEERKATPTEGSYVASIINDPAEIGCKLHEEAAELAEALAKKNEYEVAWKRLTCFSSRWLPLPTEEWTSSRQFCSCRGE